MGKSAGSPPPPPDPRLTAAAQAQANIDTARATAQLNRINQYTPFGSLVYTRTPAVQFDEAAYRAANPDVAMAIDLGRFPSGLDHYRQYGRNEGRLGVPAGYDPNAEDQWSATIILDPAEQRILDLQRAARTVYGEEAVRALEGLRGRIGAPLDIAGQLGALPSPMAIAPTIGWDEEAYLRANPDVAEAVRTGQLSSGFEHYQRWGRAEGRQAPGGFLEAPAPNIGYGAESRQRVEEALFGRLEPQLARQREALETRLRAQGLTPGTEAWRNAMDDLARAESDARLALVAQAGQEEALQAQIAQALFGQQMAGQQFRLGQQAAAFDQSRAASQLGFQQDMDVRRQALAELLAERQIPMQELAAFLTGQQVNYPNFITPAGAQVAPTDVMGAYGMQQAGQQAAYNARAQEAAAANAGAAGLASSAIMAAALFAAMSDERTKENVEKVGEVAVGDDDDEDVGVYLFNYKGEPPGTPRHLGVMAQEVERAGRRDAVFRVKGTGMRGGTRFVDYAALLFGAPQQRRTAHGAHA